MALLLHFLDRELRESVQFNKGDAYCEHLLLCSLFMSDSIYSIITNGIENSLELPGTTKLLNELLDLGIVEPLSRNFSAEEFIVSRQKLYQYDKERYPFYYGDGFDIQFPHNFIPVTGSTTEFIRRKLQERHSVQDKMPDITDNTAILNYIVTKRLDNFDGMGLTINSFNPVFKKLSKDGIRDNRSIVIKQKMNRELISIYNGRYLIFSKAHIIKSIPQIKIFDSMDKDSCYDFLIYDTILNPIFKKYSLEEIKFLLIGWKEQDEFLCIIDLLYEIVSGLIEEYTNQNTDGNYEIMVRNILSFVKRKIYRTTFGNIRFTKIEEIYYYLNNLQNSLGLSKNKKEFLSFRGGEEMTKILLPVANDTEFQVIINVAQEFGLKLQREIIGINTYHKFKTLKCEGYIVKCEAGSIGPGSSALTVTDAINNLKIDTIIFGGIAFGNYQKANKSQEIGDILVSRQLWSYEPGKEAKSFIPRGDKITATPWLIDRFQNSKLEWKDSRVHFGLVASGEKLSNSIDFAKRIIEAEPELIGGEMEGAGMVSAAIRYERSWILVKSICDWGVKKTDDFQKRAAEYAFRYIFLTITQFLF